MTIRSLQEWKEGLRRKIQFTIRNTETKRCWRVSSSNILLVNGFFHEVISIRTILEYMSETAAKSNKEFLQVLITFVVELDVEEESYVGKKLALVNNRGNR